MQDHDAKESRVQEMGPVEQFKVALLSYFGVDTEAHDNHYDDQHRPRWIGPAFKGSIHFRLIGEQPFGKRVIFVLVGVRQVIQLYEALQVGPEIPFYVDQMGNSVDYGRNEQGDSRHFVVLHVVVHWHIDADFAHPYSGQDRPAHEQDQNGSQKVDGYSGASGYD